MIVVAGATIVHRLLIVGLLHHRLDRAADLALVWRAWAAMLAETVINSVAGLHRVSSERSAAGRRRARPA